VGNFSNEIVIYDFSGKIVNQISTLRNQATWDGKNMNGKKCKPGIYIAKFKDQKTSKKILLTK
jgi:flagellar hook assembly protein FlgD